jgi:hypothetical protein
MMCAVCTLGVIQHVAKICSRYSTLCSLFACLSLSLNPLPLSLSLSLSSCIFFPTSLSSPPSTLAPLSSLPTSLSYHPSYIPSLTLLSYIPLPFPPSIPLSLSLCGLSILHCILSSSISFSLSSSLFYPPHLRYPSLLPSPILPISITHPLFPLPLFLILSPLLPRTSSITENQNVISIFMKASWNG